MVKMSWKKKEWSNKAQNKEREIDVEKIQTELKGQRKEEQIFDGKDRKMQVWIKIMR